MQKEKKKFLLEEQKDPKELMLNIQAEFKKKYESICSSNF